LNWNASQTVVVNQAIVQLATDGSLTAYLSGTTANLIIDIGGYLLTAAPATTATSAVNPTTTTILPGATFQPAELVSRAPSGEAPLGLSGQLNDVSSDGRYVLFSRQDDCGPVLRDRTAGTTARLFTRLSDGSCPVRADFAPQLSGSGAKVAVSRITTTCSPGGFSFGGSGVFTPQVLTVANLVAQEPFNCTDLAYFGSGYLDPNPFTTPAVLTGATNGRVDQVVLSGDGLSLVFIHTKTVGNYVEGCLGGGGFSFAAGTPCYQLSTARYVQTVERIAVSSGVKTVLGTLFDQSVSRDTTGNLPYVSVPTVELIGTDTTGSMAVINSDSALQVSDTNNKTDGYVVSAGTLSRLPGGAAGSIAGALSSNGQFVVFSSAAAAIVDGRDSNNQPDAFLFKRTGSTTERVSIGVADAQSNRPIGAQGMSVSDSGRYVSFVSDASTIGCPGNVSTYFIRDRTLARTYAPLRRPNGQPANSGFSASSLSFAFGGVGGSMISADGSRFVASTEDWVGSAASDPGLAAAERVWASPAAALNTVC